MSYDKKSVDLFRRVNGWSRFWILALLFLSLVYRLGTSEIIATGDSFFTTFKTKENSPGVDQTRIKHSISFDLIHKIGNRTPANYALNNEYKSEYYKKKLSHAN